MNQEQNNELDSFGEIEYFTPANSLADEEIDEISIMLNAIDEYNKE